MANVSRELLVKYATSAPRYTSYPPATHFTETGPQPVLDRIAAHRDSTRDLSLYFHLPFCHSLCWYCGCTTVITQKQSASARYLDYLGRELDLITPLLNPARKAVQLHFGGGTPTFLLPEEIRASSRQANQLRCIEALTPSRRNLPTSHRECASYPTGCG